MNNKIVIDKSVIEERINRNKKYKSFASEVIIEELRDILSLSTPFTDEVNKVASDAFDAGVMWECSNWKVGILNKPNKSEFLKSLLNK